jgi:hypothetical protein
MNSAAHKKQRIKTAKLRPQEPLYTALDHGALDFTWTKAEIIKVKQAWAEGLDVEGIDVTVNRHKDEVFLLLMDLIQKQKIKERPEGLTYWRTGPRRGRQRR